MVFVKPEFIFQSMETNEFPFYEVLDGTVRIDQCQDETTTVQRSVEMLRECLGNLTGGFVTVKISAKTKRQKAVEGRDTQLHVFNVRLGQQNVSGSESLAGIPAIASNEKALLQTIQDLRMEIIKNEYQQQLNELKKEMKAMKEEKPDTIGALAETALNYFMMQQNSNGQKPIVGIAGLQSNETTVAQAPDDKERFIAAIKAIKVVDADFTNTLEALAKIATETPDKYLMYAKMMKG